VYVEEWKCAGGVVGGAVEGYEGKVGDGSEEDEDENDVSDEG
jgi:hypothetical protein